MATSVHEEIPKDEIRKRCNMIYYNLLSMTSDTTLPSIFVRALHETQLCDNVLGSLEHVRKRYRDKMGSATYDHIQSSDDISYDQEHAAGRAAFYYFQWTEQELLKRIEWRYWVKYNFIVKAERTLSNLGILPTVRGARKVLKNHKQWV